MSVPKQVPGAAVLTATIVGCGPCPYDGGGLVYAVTVKQPVQSWTVVRSHDDFRDLGEALLSLLTFPIPSFPAGLGSGDTFDLSTVVKTRKELQGWLSALLMHPNAHAVTAISNFLTLEANTIPSQYESVAWTPFIQPSAQSPISSTIYPPQQQPPHQQHSGNSVNLDGMEMDEMFEGEDENTPAPREDQEYEEDFVPAASVRCNGMEMLQLAAAGEVEIIEDIGSLAQSNGASHPGRSLNFDNKNINSNHNKRLPPQQPGQPKLQQGLNIGGWCTQLSRVIGGIGSAIERAANNANFNHKPPVSAPRLNAFKILKLIGEASFGNVFLVKEIMTAKIYALKVLRKNNISRLNQLEHTNAERSVLGYVQHPFIVSMIMAFESKDRLYFVLDYCAGGELFFHLAKLGKFPEHRARFYAAEIILAISYLHSLHIIYRDLNPENVLLDAQGHIRLTDFGLSKEGISNSSSGSNSFWGTPEYLAPEILNREGHGRAVDWWSLGALLYEMITGLPPFYCQDRERLFAKIRTSEPGYPPSVTKPAKKVLVGLLTKDPVRRLGSGPTDAEEIKKNEFFTGLDFNKLMKGKIAPPWKPIISGSLDTSQFDKEFTKTLAFSPQCMQRAHGFGVTPDDNPLESLTFTDRLSFIAQNTSQFDKEKMTVFSPQSMQRVECFTFTGRLSLAQKMLTSVLCCCCKRQAIDGWLCVNRAHKN